MGIMFSWITLTPNEIKAFHRLTEIADETNSQREAAKCIVMLFRYKKALGGGKTYVKKKLSAFLFKNQMKTQVRNFKFE